MADDRSLNVIAVREGPNHVTEKLRAPDHGRIFRGPACLAAHFVSTLHAYPVPIAGGTIFFEKLNLACRLDG
jgi:hypothetical protein